MSDALSNSIFSQRHSAVEHVIVFADCDKVPASHSNIIPQKQTTLPRTVLGWETGGGGGIRIR